MITTTRPKQILYSGLAYGLGLLVGNVISYILFALTPANWFLYGSPVFRLVFGLLLAFFIAGVGGLFGGSVGGATLPTIGQGKERRGYVWRSGITFGFGYGLLIFPIILIVSLLSFYDISATPVYVFSVVFGLVGVIFGLIMGISMGLWTAGRRFPAITRWSAAGFGLGGVVLGATIWQFIFHIANGEVATGPYEWILFGFFLFAGLGGASLGYVYHNLAEGGGGTFLPVRSLSLKSWQRRMMITAVILLAVALLIRPVIAAVGDLLTPQDSGLSAVLDLNTIGTHWLESTNLTAVSLSSPPAITANGDGRVAVAWAQPDGLILQTGQWSAAEQQTTWQPPVQVAAGLAAEPAIALGNDGRVYLAWVQDDAVQVSYCQDGGCIPPSAIPPANLCARPPAVGDRQPALAIQGDTALLVWANEANIMPYVAWSVSGAPQATAAGCVPGGASSPQLNSAFQLVFAAESGALGMAQFDGAGWTAVGEMVNGRYPAITADANNQPHAAFCTDQGLVYWQGGQVEVVANGPCLNRPALALDNLGQVHVVWYGNYVTNANGVNQPASVVYESVRTAVGWTPPALIGQSALTARPALTAAGDGSLHVAWAGVNGLNYAAQIQYACDPADLAHFGRILYDIAREDTYQSPATIVPFCQNRYDRLILTPNPKPEYGLPYAPTPNGGFDVLGDLIRGANYEVLFSTMWYDAPLNNDSPGSVVATAVGDLYRQLQAHPEQYPRGLTVRIMLGNPPEMAMGETTGQLWTLLADLRHAGIDKMVDETLGWRLEVADYEGNLPHSHVKTVIVDGQTAVAAGFNMTYDHFPQDHPSGSGGGRFDVALQMTGPVAQSSQRMFDDMWQGADARACLQFNPPFGVPWQTTCYDYSATADHVPEAQKFYLPGDNSTAFSMYRSRVHDQADRQVEAVMAAAQETIDVVHVQFALDIICNLNILFDVCTVDESPIYTEGLIQAAQNGAHLRILVKPGPFEGVENNVALRAFLDRLQELGLEDQVEVRYFEGAMHPKTLLIDNQLLIVGSQNLHYSAFGEGGGLNEYSLATEDPRAIAEFARVFEAEWAAAMARP